MVTICTTGTDIQKYTFCPQSTFICFVRFSEQKATISLLNRKCSVFVTETYLLRGTNSFWVWFKSVGYSLAYHRVVSFRSQVSPYEICGGHSGNETGFLRMLRFFSCQYHYISAPYSSSHHIHMLLPEGQIAEAWEPSRSSGIYEIGEHGIEK